eukprot:UN09824
MIIVEESRMMLGKKIERFFQEKSVYVMILKPFYAMLLKIFFIMHVKEF